MKNKSGQALIETLIAVSVLTIGFLGLITLLSQSLSLNRVVADSYTATYLGAEGIEVVKNILDSKSIDGNWSLPEGSFEVAYDSSDLSIDQDRYLKFDPETNLYSYSGPYQSETRFKRKIEIKQEGEDEIIVTSRISWTTKGGGNFSLELEDHFFNWKKYIN